MQLSAFARDAGFQIGWSIARKLGLIPAPGFELAFQAQVQIEVGDAPDALGRKTNNPLNLTAPRADYWPGQTGLASGGSAAEPHTDFAVFGTLQDGVEAAAINYTAPSYKGVQDAIAAGAGAESIARAIAASPWSSDHYPELVADVQQLQVEQTNAAVGDGSALDQLAAYKVALQAQLEDAAYKPITQLQLDIKRIDGALKTITDELSRVAKVLEGGGANATQEATPAAS